MDSVLARKTHELKIRPEYFNAVFDGQKTFELRKDDRGFQVGDNVVLREYDINGYTGSAVVKTISYILRDCPEYGLQSGYCIIGLGEHKPRKFCCKDCKYWGDAEGVSKLPDGTRYARCNVHNYVIDGRHTGWCPLEDDYCSYGEEESKK